MDKWDYICSISIGGILITWVILVLLLDTKDYEDEQEILKNPAYYKSCLELYIVPASDCKTNSIKYLKLTQGV
tara:strand:+ start:3976 stop:4194 length:219 start_codon:yes stop_codon:yes gene_type:complete